MSTRAERLDELRRRAAWEREDLASIVREMRLTANSSKERWRFAGRAASGVAFAATAAWKLFGKNSPAAKARRIASAASLLIGLSRGVKRIRRFW
jgi:hypothetical protein